MFYLLSKIFWVVAQPLSLVAVLVLTGMVLVGFGRRRLGLAASGTGLAVLLLCSFTSLGFLLIGPLEARFVQPAVAPAQAETIVVLGGSTLARVSTVRGRAELNEAGDRLVEAAILARRYPSARIIFSGGAGLLEPGGEPEAATAERLLLALGVAPERLMLDDQARNTDENADLTAALLGDSSGTVLLVTSAFHMPRSVGLFRRLGINVVPWPTDYRGSGQEGFDIDLANPPHNLNTTSIAIREWIGLVAYHWTGRIDEMFPGPN